MKMVKKILLGLAATAAVIGFVSCKTSDDSQKAINGSGNNYDIDFTNDGDTNYRAYESTSLKHAGALVQVKFNDPDPSNFSKMGIIFDLHKNAANEDAKDFYIIGLAAATGDKNFYVSKMESIVDIQADNFGASTTATAGNPKETELVPLSTVNKISTLPAAATDGSVSFYVYYKSFANDGENPTKGYYEWGVFNFTDANAEVAKALMKKETNGADLASLKALAVDGVALKEGTIPNAFDLGTNGALPQNQIAVYAMVGAKKSLKGEWHFLDMYKEAEEIEE